MSRALLMSNSFGSLHIRKKWCKSRVLAKNRVFRGKTGFYLPLPVKTEVYSQTQEISRVWRYRVYTRILFILFIYIYMCVCVINYDYIMYVQGTGVLRPCSSPTSTASSRNSVQDRPLSSSGELGEIHRNP